MSDFGRVWPRQFDVDDGQGGTKHEERFSVHGFITGTRDNYYGLGAGIILLAVILLTVAIVRLPLPNRFSLLLSLALSAVLVFIATRWLRETRKLGLEWCATDHQLRTMLRAPKGFHKRTLACMAHVLIEQETKINVLRRHTKWLLMRNLAPPTLAIVILCYIWANVPTSHMIGLRWFKRFLRNWNPTQDNKDFIKSVPRDYELDWSWLFLLILAGLVVVVVMVWIRWNYTYFMVTDRRIFPDLRLPPIWLPFMSKNELANDLTSIKSVDNIDDWRQNILGYGSIEIASDVERSQSDSDTNRLRVISHMSDHRVLAHAINTAVQEAKRLVNS